MNNTNTSTRVEVDIKTHPVFSTYTPADFAMAFIEQNAYIDGAMHKAWLIDQVSRILKGTPVRVFTTSVEYGADVLTFLDMYDLEVGAPSKDYETWRVHMDTHESYNPGYAP